MKHRLLPDGVKPLDEICGYPLSDQTVFLVTLLEYLLRRLAGQVAIGLTLGELILLNNEAFTCSEGELHQARWVRNQVIHGTGRASYEQVVCAVNALEQAIHDVLVVLPKRGIATPVRNVEAHQFSTSV